MFALLGNENQIMCYGIVVLERKDGRYGQEPVFLVDTIEGYELPPMSAILFAPR